MLYYVMMFISFVIFFLSWLLWTKVVEYRIYGPEYVLVMFTALLASVVWFLTLPVSVLAVVGFFIYRKFVSNLLDKVADKIREKQINERKFK